MGSLEITPSSSLSDIALGETFVLNNKRYMLVYRDPWKAKAVRYTKLDEFLANLVDRVLRRK